MMKRTIITLIAGMMLCLGATASQATTVLNEFAFNINSTIYDNVYYNGSVAQPSSTNSPMFATPSFNTATGIGSITLDYSVAGTYNIGAFFDHAILDNSNSFASDFGTVSGSAPAGASWQIADPWGPSIYSNFATNTLDNTNAQLFVVNELNTNDVSLALARNFTLGSYQKAHLVFTVSEANPGGFYLQQTNANTLENIFLSSTLDITDVPQPPDPGTNPVPEPSTFMLLGSALAGLGFYTRRRKNS